MTELVPSRAVEKDEAQDTSKPVVLVWPLLIRSAAIIDLRAAKLSHVGSWLRSAAETSLSHVSTALVPGASDDDRAALGSPLEGPLLLPANR